jgi:hypothetical protein
MTDPSKSSIPGCRYDVFFSYAQANDHDGWVTRFKEELTALLNERLDNEPQIFWDEQSLKLNDDLDSTITEAVRQSAVMVIVVSHKYLTRQWCSLERETFLQNGDERRVMIVRYDDVSFQDFQQVLPKCLGIEFFDDDCLPLETDTREFKKRLHKLRMTIVEELDTLRNQVASQKAAAVPSAPGQPQPTEPASPPASVDSSEPLVFVAAVPPSGEMINRRDELISFLDDCGIATVTPADYFFMQPDFESAIAADLDRCNGFVQLLDTVPIPPPPNMAEGMERWFLAQVRQHEHLAVLRWRRAEPAAETGDFHDLALEPDVRPFEFARFCELVRDEAHSRHQTRRAEARLASTSTPPLLVLRACPDDEALGEAVARQLEEHPVDLMDVPSSMIDSLDELTAQLPAGGLLVVFRRSREVLQRIQELRRFTVSEAARNWVLGFWNSPEDPKKSIRPRSLKNVHIINDGDHAALSAFVGEVLQKAGQA